jgi:hypothetical protein
MTHFLPFTIENIGLIGSLADLLENCRLARVSSANNQNTEAMSSFAKVLVSTFLLRIGARVRHGMVDRGQLMMIADRV